MSSPDGDVGTASRRVLAPVHLFAVAWAVVLGASLLPRVLVQEVLGRDFTDDFRLAVSAAVIATALVATAVWTRLRALVPVVVALGVLVGAEALVYRVVDQAPAYQAWLADPSFSVYMLAEQSLRLMVTAIMIAALLVLRRRPSRFFMAVGDLHAPMHRIPGLGVKDDTRWSRFGPLAAAGLSAGTLTFVLLAGGPAPDVIARAVPLLPVILLAAALNAFSEEVAWKASLLSVLEGPVGPRQAVLMVAAYFGIGHYYGIPYGLIGVAMAFALGWLLARSMVETRGLFWAWFIHFCQDVIIFSFLAIGSITPGGA